MTNDGSPPPVPPHLHTIFVDTSIDTHLALIVSLHDTISDVKWKIRAEHALCFQDIGEIAIKAIKVRRRGFFYNLADSMYVLNAFDGVKGSWFVCIDAVPMCTVKDQKLLTNNVSHGHQEHCNSVLPVCGVDTCQEITFSGFPPKNQDAVTMLLAQDLNTVSPSTSVEHKNQKSLDSSLKELPAEDGPSLQNGNIGRSQSLQVCSIDLLISGDKNIKTLNATKVNEAYLHDGVTVSQFEPEKISNLDGQRSHNPIVTRTDHSHRPEMLNDQEKDGGRKNDGKDLGVKSSDVMPSTCTHTTNFRKRGKRLKNGFHDEHLGDHKSGSKINRSENNDESYKSMNLPGEINCDGKKEILATSEILSSKLLHENTAVLQNPPVEKLTKKRKRKSLKLHEEAHLAMPSEILIVRSSQLTENPHNSGKEGTASIFLEKHPSELNNNKLLSNDDRDMNKASDTASFLEIPNQKEFGHVMETCLNKETIEVQNFQVNPVNRRKKHVNLGQETNLDVSLKEPEEARISVQVTSEFPIKLSYNASNLESHSRKVLSCVETSDHQEEFDAVKCITDLNHKEDEAGSVDAMVVISASSERSPYQENASNLLSKVSSSDKNQCLDKEIDAAANPETANGDICSTKVNSKVPSTSRRSRKKSKESLRIFDPIKVKVNGDHFNSDGAEVFLGDFQNDSDATIFMKQVNQKVSGGYSLDTIIELSSSSKKLSNQDLVPDMNSVNPPIIIPHILSKKSSASVKTAAEINSSSQPPSEVQVKQRHLRKKSKNKLSKLISPEISDVVLPKFNGEVTESNEGRGSDSSKLDNLSNQKIEQHCIDANLILPFSHANFSTLDKVHQVNPLDSSSCKLLDLSGQFNAEIINKDDDVAQHGYLASPTKSKSDRKKSKQEKLESQVFSEMSEHFELHRPDISSLNFVDSFVPKEGKHRPDVHSKDLPSEKSETRRKSRTSRKTNINQPYQDCSTNLVQPSSKKQHVVTGQHEVNDSSQHKQHKDTCQIQDNYRSHLNVIDSSQFATTTDYKSGNALRAKATKHSSKQNMSSRMESDSSLHKTRDNQKCEKKLQDYGPQLHVQLSKSGDMHSKHEKNIIADGKGETRSLPPAHGIDNIVSKGDGVRYKGHHSSIISTPVCDVLGLNTFDVSLSKTMAIEEDASDSTKDTQDHNSQYKVVRKNPKGMSKKKINTNSDKLLSASPGKMFSYASGASSDCRSSSYEEKAAIRTGLDGLSACGDSESHLEEVQAKPNAWKLQMDTCFSDAESDKSREVGKCTDGKVEDRSRSAVSTQKILKRSSSYKKDRLTASQSEFVDGESQPIDVVLETQPVPAT